LLNIIHALKKDILTQVLFSANLIISHEVWEGCQQTSS